MTTLCRDVCGYCTFARPPRRGERAFLTEDEVLAIGRVGAEAGWPEALFTFGDKPELRYRVARDELAALGCGTTIDYLARSRLVLEETGLLPHLNPGVMTRGMERLRPVARRWGSCSRRPRSGSARAAARTWPRPTSCRPHGSRRCVSPASAVPFTTGILIGIGETREERLDALRAIAAARGHGHVQEVIVQNFRAKPGTRMAGAPEPPLDEHLWTIAAARLILPPDVHVQAPPNLDATSSRGCSTRASTTGAASRRSRSTTSTPRRRGPSSSGSRGRRASRGLELAPRLTVYPRLRRTAAWLDPAVLPTALRASDSLGLAREDRGRPASTPRRCRSSSAATRRRSSTGGELGEDEIARLFRARGEERQRVFAAADALRREV